MPSAAQARAQASPPPRLSRSSSIVSEIRKKPSPFVPYAPPGDTTTADSSSTISQYDAELWPSGTGAQT